MADTYCGKSCTECQQHEELDCFGCKASPGNYNGDCAIAKCCRSKSHESCETCTMQASCATLRGKDAVPITRIRRSETDKAAAEEALRRAPVLGKWLWIMFWILIANMVGNILMRIDALSHFGTAFGVICSLGIFLCFWKLRGISSCYKTVSYCYLGIIAVNIITEVFYTILEAETFTFLGGLLLIPLAIIWLVCEYNEYNGHTEVTRYADSVLSEKWQKLWKLFVYSLVGAAGSFILALILPVLGLIALIVCLIALLIFSILKLKYLYDTAYLFRDLTEN